MSGPDHRAWIEVSVAAVLENARTVARRTGARLLPVVKANAYGLGAVGVSGALEAVAPWGYAVATIEEAAELRAAGIARPLVVLTPARPDDLATLQRLDLRPVLDTPAMVRTWGSRGPFHLEIDTGMGRSGVRWDAVDELRDALGASPLEGAFTQCHSADVANDTAGGQLARFQEAVARLPRRPALLHIANSAAALRDRRFALDLVRPGIFLYGGRPGAGLPEGQSVVRLRARVVSVRRLRRGDSVSYGARWTAPRDTTIATLAMGYADGPRRQLGLGAGAYVLLNGVRCPIAGVVTMDFTMVDVGETPVQVGDVATLLGEDGGERITLEQFAAWSGDLQHAVLTSLGSRPPRIFT